MSTPTTRCFIAINLPPEIRRALAQQQAHFRSQLSHRALRWVAPERLHLTLLFLGDVPYPRLGEIESALRDACAGVQPFELHSSSLGCFPSTRRPRVLWAGVEGETSFLLQLQSRVAAQLKNFVSQPDEKTFHPHITLARINTADSALSRRVGQIVEEAKTSQRICWKVDSVELMRSLLTPSGPEYSRETSIPLERG